MNAPRAEDDPVTLIRQRTQAAAAARVAERARLRELAAEDAQEAEDLPEAEEPDGGLDALDGSAPPAGGPIGALLAKLQTAFTKLVPEPEEDDDSPRSVVLRRLRALPLLVLAGGPLAALLLFMATCSMLSGPSAPAAIAVDKLPAPPAGLAGNANLAVHYAAFTGDRSLKQLRIGFRPSDRPYVLFLAVQHDGGLRITLENAPEEQLRAVVVNTAASGLQIEGLPGDAKAYVLREPKLYAANARAAAGSTPAASVCEATGDGGAPIRTLDRELERVAKARPASFAAANMAAAMTVPGTPLNDALRAGLSREAARLCERALAEQRLQRISTAFHGMLMTTQARQSRELGARHPAFDDRSIRRRTKAVKVVTVESGDTSEHDYFKKFVDYEAYVANQEKRRATVTVRVETGLPTFLVLTSVEPVTWRVDLKDGASLTGVYVGSDDVSTIVDLPTSVPLLIESKASGAQRRFPTLRSPEDRVRQRLVRELHDRFPDAALEIDYHRRVSAVAAELTGRDEIRGRN
jgi:hypothetical protein